VIHVAARDSCFYLEEPISIVGFTIPSPTRRIYSSVCLYMPADGCDYGLPFRSHNVLFTHKILHVFPRLLVRFSTLSRVPLGKHLFSFLSLITIIAVISLCVIEPNIQHLLSRVTSTTSTYFGIFDIF